MRPLPEKADQHQNDATRYGSWFWKSLINLPWWSHFHDGLLTNTWSQLWKLTWLLCKRVRKPNLLNVWINEHFVCRLLSTCGPASPAGKHRRRWVAQNDGLILNLLLWWQEKRAEHVRLLLYGYGTEYLFSNRLVFLQRVWLLNWLFSRSYLVGINSGETNN